MKPIDEMTPEEKSAKLIVLMAWQKKWSDMQSMVLLDADGLGVGYKLMQSGDKMPNLYDPENMSLAWLVLNWAEDYAHDKTTTFYIGWMSLLPESLFELGPAEAQKEWLDKILSLAIEAGLVEDTAVSQEGGE